VAIDICPHLKRREGDIFICTKSGKPIDIMFRPYLLSAKERKHHCPLLWGERK
jgi:hypothetical protein